MNTMTFEEFKTCMLIDGWSYSRYSYTRYGEHDPSLINTTRWEKGTHRLWWTPDNQGRHGFQYIMDNGEVKIVHTFETMLKILEEWESKK